MDDIFQDNRLNLLFVTISKHGDIVNCQHGRSFAHFEGFVLNAANKAIEREIVPDRLICCMISDRMPLEFTEKNIYDPEKAQEYVRTSAIREEWKVCKDFPTYRLKDVVYAVDRNLPESMRQGSLPPSIDRKDYDECMWNWETGIGKFRSMKTSGVKAIEIDGRVVLFDLHKKEDVRAYREFLERQADRFWEPSTKIRKLTVYGVRKRDENLLKKLPEHVNHIPLDEDGRPVKNVSYSFQEIEGLGLTPLREYDMAPTKENFWKFVNDDNGENVHISQRNQDILRTLSIKENGLIPDLVFKTGYPKVETCLYKYDPQFLKIYMGMDSTRDPLVLASLKIESQKIAQDILDNELKDIRKPHVKAPKVKQPAGIKKISKIR